MCFAQNNRFYCVDCNKSYIPKKNSNHLKFKGHSNAVMKKCCCSCNNDKTYCNNHELACSINGLSLKSNDTIKTDFPT